MTQDELLKYVLDASHKFNDRTLQIVGLVGGAVLAVLTVVAGLTAFNLNSERDRLERATSALDEKFSKLTAEVKGQRSETPRIEILATKDKQPLAGRALETPAIRQATELASKPYRISLSYTLRNAGAGSAGRVWTKVYLESTDLFSGELNPDEPGFGIQSSIPHTSWSGDLSGTNGDFPGGGFSTNVQSSIVILGDRIPKGRYKVLLKVYYGYPETRVERVETYFDLFSDWTRPKPSN